jgi:hypothetical protein
MTAVSDLINRTRNDYLRTGQPEVRNKLNGAISDSAELLTFSRPLNALSTGSRISIGLEDMHVWSADSAASTADVDRGEYGTTAASADDKAVVLVNPRYSDSQILRALNSGVSMLASEGLFAVSTIEVTHQTGVNGYDLASSVNVLGLVDVLWESPTALQKQWSRLPHVRLIRNANSSDFASGTGVAIDRGVPNGATIRVTYKHELSASLSGLADAFETATGLESDAIDLVCIAAALHLTAGKEIALNEPDAARPRRSSETPPGTFSQADSNLRTLYRDRVRAERRRLNDKHATFRVREFVI